MGNTESRGRNTGSLNDAATTGDLETLEALIQGGADVNEKNNKGYVPLIQAASNAHEQCVELLIRAGANVNIVDKLGRMVLITAVEKCSYRCVKMVLKAGADVNQRNTNGSTSLLHASKEINYNCAKLLIRSGADVNIVDDFGYTPLKAVVHKADIIFQSGLIFIYSKALNCVNLFLRSGAHVNNSKIYYSRPIIEHVEQRKSPTRRKLLVMLFAAGENIDGTTVEKVETDGAVNYVNTADLMIEEHVKLSLKHLCRKLIRQQLLHVNLPVNLFIKVPQLGLPSLIQKYLLYDMSLDI